MAAAPTRFAVDAAEDGADGEAQAAKGPRDAAAAVGRRQHAAPLPPHAPCRQQKQLYFVLYPI